MRRLWLVALILVAIVATSCAAQPAAPPAAIAAGQGQPAAASGTIQITGAGGTFPDPLYSRWFHDYAAIDPSVQFNYQAIGSGAGIQQITAKTVDFGGSDAILTADQQSAAPGLLMVPTVAGAVVIAYNVQDANGQDIPSGLKLTPAVIAGIYLGKITQWNDPQIAALNPSVRLPDHGIVVAHRSDGSGTTFIFTSYLSQISADWKSQVGASTSVSWPVGLGGKGNAGVAGIIKQQPDGIGYIELAYAMQNKIPYAVLQNQAGKFVEATVASTTAASNALAADMPANMGQLLVNAPGDDSYPIAGYTFLLIYQDSKDCAKAQKIAEFVRWAMNQGDQDATDLYYAPLGAAAKKAVLDRLQTLTCQGKPVLSK